MYISATRQKIYRERHAAARRRLVEAETARLQLGNQVLQRLKLLVEEPKNAP